MFARIKRLLSYKLSVNVTIVTPPAAGVRTTTVPRVVVHEPPRVLKKKHNNLRFVEELTVDSDGTERVWYFTEEYCDGRWELLGVFHRDKAKAMQHHLEILEKGVREPSKTKSVLWEGLSKEETRTWIAVSGE